MQGVDEENLGKFIAKRRKSMGLTQEDLAERVGVSKSAIAKWETNGGFPDRDNLKRLSEEINVSVDKLHRIIKSDYDKEDITSVNITADVVSILESYGYKVIRPDKKR